MVDERRILEEVDKTLRSYDGEGPLEENPFLYSRLQAAREGRLHQRGFWFSLQPGLKYAGMVLLLLINLITALYFGRHADTDPHDRLVSELKEEFQIDQTQDNF